MNYLSRYGFNGKERDPEGMGGGGSTYDYGFRIYNPQIGKFLSVDPLTASYPMLTPYQFAGNTPIQAIDLDGLEPAWANDLWNATTSGYNTAVKVVSENYTAAVNNTTEAYNKAATTIKEQYDKSVSTFSVSAKVTIGGRFAAELKNGVGVDANIGSLDAVSFKYEQQKSDDGPQKVEFDYLNKGDGENFTAGLEGAYPTPYGAVTAGYEYSNNPSNVGKKGGTSTGKLGYGAIVGGTAQAQVNHDTGEVKSSATIGGGFKIGLVIVLDVDIQTGLTTDKID